MKIPLHWSRATYEAADPGNVNHPISMTRWRWSDISPEDAHESALQAAKEAWQQFVTNVESFPNRHYLYGTSPVREEMIQRFTNAENELDAAVTRNHYGALVLNTASAMFIDLDFPPVSLGERVKHAFRKFFGRPTVSPALQHEREVKDRMERFWDAHRDWSIRVYRTHSGMRGLVTHAKFSPTDAAAIAALESVGADPLFTRLCRLQESFRARLTPKPWRIGHGDPESEWPRNDAKSQEDFHRWLTDYDSLQKNYATCRYVGTLGLGIVHPDIAMIVEVHDKLTRCNENLDLA
jgi:hypothetical protein